MTPISLTCNSKSHTSEGMSISMRSKYRLSTNGNAPQNKRSPITSPTASNTHLPVTEFSKCLEEYSNEYIKASCLIRYRTSLSVLRSHLPWELITKIMGYVKKIEKEAIAEKALELIQ